MNAVTSLEYAQAFLQGLDQLVLGKRPQARLLLETLLAGGHVLLNDVPGVAKTRLVKATAALSNLTFARVQGTPDLLPSDITGGPIYDLKTSELIFRPGPVFHHFLLVDEINRATPRTQAALLECMEERQVTSDGTTHALPQPFLVMATQNPVEMEGTFPLPEAQLDRFWTSFSLGYPSAEDEEMLITRFGHRDPLRDAQPVLSAEAFEALVSALDEVEINGPTLSYLVAICRNTRNHPLVRLGTSPRATMQFSRLARARALLEGRAYVIPDDIKGLAPAALAHRLIPSTEAEVGRITGEDIIAQIIQETPVPVEVHP